MCRWVHKCHGVQHHSFFPWWRMFPHQRQQPRNQPMSWRGRTPWSRNHQGQLHSESMVDCPWFCPCVCSASSLDHHRPVGWFPQRRTLIPSFQLPIQLPRESKYDTHQLQHRSASVMLHTIETILGGCKSRCSTCHASRIPWHAMTWRWPVFCLGPATQCLCSIAILLL